MILRFRVFFEGRFMSGVELPVSVVHGYESDHIRGGTRTEPLNVLERRKGTRKYVSIPDTLTLYLHLP